MVIRMFVTRRFTPGMSTGVNLYIPHGFFFCALFVQHTRP